jgi:O-antigen/teichoic acid export membrane protein
LSDQRTPTTTEDGKEQQALTSGGLLARNAVWNLLSHCAPMATAIFTIPVLIAGLGKDRFGVLTLAWMVLGYFSLFDLGLGRALTKMVAEKLGLGLGRELPCLVGTALGLMMGLGLAGTAFIALISPGLVRDVLKIPPAIQHESLYAFYLMAVSLPFVISTAGLRGVMEAHQRFGLINVVRTAIGLFSLIGPILVLPFSRSLVPVVAVIFAGRLVSWAIHMVLCLRTVPNLIRGFSIRPDLIKPLITFGGWMTLTNIINPLMVQMDRFAVGALVSTAAIAYYTTPYELVTKFWFLSNSILGVMFPAFATCFVSDRERTALMFGRTMKSIFLILFPVTLGAVTLAPEVLTLWLGSDFATQSTHVMQCLAVGVFFNGLAQVSSALIQGVGRPELTFKLHLTELFPYLVAAWFLIRGYGIEGAALAWTARTALDLALFFWGGGQVLPECKETIRRLSRGLALTLPLIGLGALPLGLAWRATYLAVVMTGAPIIVWQRVLTAEEKDILRTRFVNAWSSRVLCRSVAGLGFRTAAEATNPPLG